MTMQFKSHDLIDLEEVWVICGNLCSPWLHKDAKGLQMMSCCDPQYLC